MSCKEDAVTWNAMFSGYNRMKRYEDTRKLFGEMELKGLLSTSVTFVLVLSACAKLKDLDVGKRVHSLWRNGCCT
ncbi:hypothetical protein Pint_10212 [Pistacia integerrima]|nr:hypothetical protein Pint_10212 [Pistacia integerrima]